MFQNLALNQYQMQGKFHLREITCFISSEEHRVSSKKINKMELICTQKCNKGIFIRVVIIVMTITIPCVP